MPSRLPSEQLSQYEADGTASERRTTEILALDSYRGTHVDKVNSSSYQRPDTKKFKEGDLVLVARGTALSFAVKWPPLLFKYYELCVIVKDNHSCYKPKSFHSRSSRQEVYAHLLCEFYPSFRALLQGSIV